MGLSEKNRALIERVTLAPVNAETPITMDTHSLNLVIEAARDEAVAERKGAWRSDALMQHLDMVRGNIAGLRPGDAETIADAQTRIMSLEAKLAAEREGRS